MRRFQRFELLVGEEKINILKNKKVLILGVGGVGGYVAEALSRCAVGTIILVDYDVVDITNINRQIIALSSTIGKKKIDVLEERIKDINPYCNVIKVDKYIEENYKELFDICNLDFVIDCCDAIRAKKNVIKYSLENNINIVSSMGVGNRLDPTKLEIMDIKKTSGDPIARIIRKYLKDEKIDKKCYVLCSSEIPIKKGSEIATSIFTPAVGGLLIANHVIGSIIKDV